MKKFILISSAVVLIMLIASLIIANSDSFISFDETTEKEYSKSETDFNGTTEAVISEATNTYIPGMSSLFTVDSWLRICSIEEINGKTALIAENISDENVEFAVLTLKTVDRELTFNISALMRETKAYLICNEDFSDDIKEKIVSKKTDNKILYKEQPTVNDDTLIITAEKSTVSVKNISDKDISSNINIYYKETYNGLVNGSVTHRVKLSGLKSGALTYVTADGINFDNCRILFSEYETEI